jgi:hypothetical protein
MIKYARYSVSKLYPPESNHEMRNIHSQITSSSSPDHHKHSVLYYLLRDISHSSHRRAEEFAKASYLPVKYRTFIDGIWYLDRKRFEVIISSRFMDGTDIHL